MVRCNVKGCTRTQKKNKNHSFFSEPKNLMIRKQWRKFAGITNNPKDFRICSDHFELSCYRKRTPPRWLLYREAVPTIRTNPKKTSPSLRVEKQNVEKNIKQPLAYELNDENFNVRKDEEITISRMSLSNKCVHTGNNIILDVEKATDVRPALVTIQTNSKINLVVKGIQCFCHNGP